MTNSNQKRERKGLELRILGTVQGVGFRPFVYNLAAQLGISGTVSNTSAGVFVRAAADADPLARFATLLKEEAPPLAHITSIDTHPLDASEIDHLDFRILASDSASSATTAIPPDIALCDDCLQELLDPADRRYRYPFINCTNCGPRFTIVDTIPYDRPKTSMKVFPMCNDCQEEYDNPANRRFHAQPNACPHCGPHISWHGADGSPIAGDDPLALAVAALGDDKILAIRSLGGFHLTANACSEEAVGRLRQRKNRPSKPLAIMVPDLETARRYCHLCDDEASMLTSPQHPIVLLRRRTRNELAETLCPGVDDIGIMLPYTPLHHLLFQHRNCPQALVMTSGNISGHPICTSNEAALAQLAAIADNFLLHNRDILTRVDDSVGKRIAGEFRLFRRARGYTPSPLQLPVPLPPVLGCGGGLKSTFCLGRDHTAVLSQHIGDLFNLQSYDFYTESIAHLQQVFQIEPELVVRDLHPEYMSSRFAEELGLPVYTVQHHHAHAVAVMAEHKLLDPVLAVVLDGTGYAADGTIWGGEILLSGLDHFRRLGHLSHLLLPGGDKASAEPWRMGLSALYQIKGRDCLRSKYLPDLLNSVNSSQREIVVEMMENRFNTLPTSSCGRLFDAVASLLDLRLRSDFEGHAAMELEALASRELSPDWLNRLDLSMERNLPSSFFTENHGKWEINSSEFVKMVTDRYASGCSASRVAGDFHIELICAITTLVKKFSTELTIDKVVLSGGCMQNRLLMEGLFHTLKKVGLQVYSGAKVPVNDGGVSFGQILIGGFQHVSRNSHESNAGSR